MASRYAAYAFMIVLISSMGVTIPVFGAGLDEYNVPPLSVQTDNDSYDQGDIVIVAGLVKNPEEGIPITLRILDPNSKLVQIDQFNPASDGSFSKTYVATGPLWKASGNYTITTQYGAQKADTTFSFSGGTGSSEKNKIEKQVFTIDVGGVGKFDVGYIIKGGTVKNMEIDSGSLALVITIDATKEGTITVTLPRDMMDAKKPANLSPDDILAGKTVNPKDLDDDEFFVLISGEETNFKETLKTESSRTLSIGFAADDTQIEIIGTQIVPEFGAIAALVLAVAIISIIAVSAKTRLRLMPKY